MICETKSIYSLLCLGRFLRISIGFVTWLASSKAHSAEISAEHCKKVTNHRRIFQLPSMSLDNNRLVMTTKQGMTTAGGQAPRYALSALQRSLGDAGPL